MSAQPPRRSRKLDWVWQLRIELLDAQPLVWRRLLVPADITLPKLDRVIQTALGWTNSHLHEFVINGTHYAVLDPDWVDDLPHVDERRVVLHEALGMGTRCFDYVYDFGDDWHHLVLVEDLYPDGPSQPRQSNASAARTPVRPKTSAAPVGMSNSWPRLPIRVTRNTRTTSIGSAGTSTPRGSTVQRSIGRWPRSNSERQGGLGRTLTNHLVLRT